MPGRKSAVLELPDDKRKSLMDAILKGESRKSVARRFGLAPSSVNRFVRRYLQPAMALAAHRTGIEPVQNDARRLESLSRAAIATVEPLSVTDPFIARMEKKYSRLESGLCKSLGKVDYDGKEHAALERAESEAIRLHAELAGRLAQPSGPTTNVYVALAVTGQSLAPVGEVIDVLPE